MLLTFTVGLLTFLFVLVVVLVSDRVHVKFGSDFWSIIFIVVTIFALGAAIRKVFGF